MNPRFFGFLLRILAYFGIDFLCADRLSSAQPRRVPQTVFVGAGIEPKARYSIGSSVSEASGIRVVFH